MERAESEVGWVMSSIAVSLVALSSKPFTVWPSWTWLLNLCLFRMCPFVLCLLGMRSWVCTCFCMSSMVFLLWLCWLLFLAFCSWLSSNCFRERIEIQWCPSVWFFEWVALFSACFWEICPFSPKMEFVTIRETSLPFFLSFGDFFFTELVLSGCFPELSTCFRALFIGMLLLCVCHVLISSLCVFSGLLNTSCFSILLPSLSLSECTALITFLNISTLNIVSLLSVVDCSRYRVWPNPPCERQWALAALAACFAVGTA